MMGEKGVVGVGTDDMGEGMQCPEHPYQANPGGICAFCLQDRLGKLVSSSNSSPFFFSSSSSTSPPPPPPSSTTKPTTHTFRTKIPFLSTTHHTKKKANRTTAGAPSKKIAATTNLNLLKRSKSVAPRDATTESPRLKKSFWSFLYPTPKQDTTPQQPTPVPDDDVAPDSPALPLGRNVARSRSVGCGSRSFSSDFLDRISTGFVDCTLRRVESSREAKTKGAPDEEGIKERVKCGGIFGGFGVISASSYWLSAAAEGFDGRTRPHVRGGRWAWASLASPMRAFRPTSSSKGFGTTTVRFSGGRGGGGNSKACSNTSLLAAG